MKVVKIFSAAIILFAISAHAASYDEDIKGFSRINSSTSTGGVITISQPGYAAATNLVRNIKNNPTAMKSFESKLLDTSCRNNKGGKNGTVNWGTDQIQITCPNGTIGAYNPTRAFREAHCAAFCTVYGNGFKDYTETVDKGCTCRKGNACTLGTTSATETSSTPASTTQSVPASEESEKEPVEQESDSDTGTVTKTKKDLRAAKKEDKQKEKAAAEQKKKEEAESECAKKTPKQVAKKNGLGVWVCADSPETIAEREKQKATNKDLKAFWDDIDTAEKAFNNRVKQLKKSK